MEILNTTGHISQIGVSRDELLILNAALNEICNGIQIFEFETRIGADRKHVAGLLNEINGLIDRMDRNEEASALR